METATTRSRAQEPYPAAPLRFVAFEAQFGLAPSLATPDGRAAVYERLRESYPIADAQVTLQVAVGPQGALPGPPAVSDLVMMNRERTRSATVGPTALTVQSTFFSDSDEFVAAVTEALAAVEPAGIATIRRVGLRFIDEIRIPGVELAAQWAGYVNTDLLGPVRFAGDYSVEGSETHLAMLIDDNVRAIVRFGPSTGFAVDPRGRLRLPMVDDGPFFLLDIDTFWQPGEDDLPPFAVDDIVDIFWRLDAPSHQLFERAIEDPARAVFRDEKS